VSETALELKGGANLPSGNGPEEVATRYMPPLRDLTKGVLFEGGNGKEQYLERLVERRIQNVIESSGPLRPIVGHLARAKGKFLRPRLVIWSGKACNPEGSIEADALEPFIDAAASCELVHMASLVHDDIIDGASRRRGLPTINVIWGIHSAILAGDLLFTKAYALTTKYSDLGIPGILNRAVEAMCRGEVAQDIRLFDLSVTEQDYLSQISGKTAALFSASCHMGAVLSDAPARVQTALRRYGGDLGRAFQIIDDIIDIVSNEDAAGKPVCSDLRRGSVTLPLILALQDGIDASFCRSFQAKALPEETVQRLREYLIRGGYVRRAGERALSFLRRAVSNLEVLPSSLARATLEGLGRSLEQKLIILSNGCHSASYVDTVDISLPNRPNASS